MSLGSGDCGQEFDVEITLSRKRLKEQKEIVAGCQGRLSNLVGAERRLNRLARTAAPHPCLGFAIPPSPLPDVPDLKDATVDGSLSVRERLAEHRSNAACAGCHNLMDPIGLSLEQFPRVIASRTV